VRRTGMTDSLELMLDIICNTFGGIILITILLAVLTRNTVSSREQEIQEALKQLAAATERDRLKAEVENLQENNETLRRLLGDMPKQVEDLAREKVDLENRGRELRDQIRNLSQRERLAALHEQEVEEELENVREEVKRKQKELKAKTEELSTLKARTTFSIVLPKERASSGYFIALILRYDRMYVWHKYDSHGRRLGLNVGEFFIVGERIDGIVVTPRPERGIPITHENAALIVKRLRQCGPANELDIGLWSDTFDTWQIFRKAVIEGGFRYRLLLFNDGEELRDRGGSGAQVQ